MMGGKKRMGVIAHTGSNILHVIDRYRKIASKSGASIELQLCTTTAEIWSAMKKLQGLTLAKLLVYYYQEKFVINLKPLNLLQQEIPETVTT